MFRRPGIPVVRTVLVGALLACLGLISASYTAALSSDVTLHIPVGTILVQGKTSPHAQIKIHENGNEQPAASIIADGSGVFASELPQDSVGLVDVSVQATDTSGKQSILVTKQVAVIAQQTSTLTVIIPPTITVSPDSAVLKQGTLNFSGQAIPNATVKVTIEPSTVLTAAADSEGKYKVPLLVESLSSVGIYTFGVEVAAGTDVSDYVVAGTFAITPPAQPPARPPSRLFGGFTAQFMRQPITAPEIAFPTESEYTSAQPFVMTGRATAGAIITLYDNNAVIGAVLAGEDGIWQFYFSPYKKLHTLHAQACQEGRCSDSSRTITIHRPDSSNLPACRPGIALEEHHLTATIGKLLGVSGSIPEGSAGIVYVSWGDGSNERFGIGSSNQLNATHTYQDTGTYSGYIIVNDSKSCQTATYFSVEATRPTITNLAAVTLLIVALAASIIGSIAWVAYRFRK